MNKWKNEKLSKLCTRIGDGLHGTPQYSDNSDIYFINGNNIKNGIIEINDSTKKVDIEEFEKNYIPLNDKTLLLSINGTLGSLAFYNNEKVMLGKSAAYLNFKTDINKFYYYYFQLENVQQYFYNVATGSTIKNLSLKSIQDYEVPVPEKHEWENISNVLSSLDSKIALNNRINAELEAMAKTVYDYWFVQFDFPFPSTSSGTGNNNAPGYKSSGGKMVWSEELKREIPEGWEIMPINQIIEVKDGTHDSPKAKSEGFRLITSKNLLPSGLDFDSANFISKEDYININKRSKVDTGDILFSMIGSIGVVYKVEDEEINFAVKNVALYKTSQKPDYKNYIYQYLKSYDMEKYMGNVISGSIQKFISLGSLRNMPLLINDDIILKFQKATEHLFIQLENNKKQNQQLSSLRDWLLPMLMNGQVVSTTLNNQESTTLNNQESATLNNQESTTLNNQEEEWLMAAEPGVEYGKK